MILEYHLYRAKLEDFYYNKTLQENIEYLNKHGKGPYEYNGKFANRVTPYLCVGYWMEYQHWLEENFGAALNNDVLAFTTEKAALMFILRWS